MGTPLLGMGSPPDLPVEGPLSFIQLLLIEHQLCTGPGAGATSVSRMQELCSLRGAGWGQGFDSPLGEAL